MKIMTFNTQHCLSYLDNKIDFEIMAQVIRESGAEVVGLNEILGIGVDAEYTAQTEKLAELSGKPYYYFAKAIDIENKGPYGNAMLSDIPIREVKTVIIPDPNPKKYDNDDYETRCILCAELECGLRVLIVHVGLNPDEKENAISTLLEYITDEKCILMGDFNLLPDSPLLLPIRERMKDAAELFTEEKLSFPSDAPRIKIDYIFTSKDIEIVTADIPAITASDHRPHTAEIKI